MEKGKFCGGYDFRDLNLFNLALFTNLGWRFIVNFDNLWAKVMKGLYFSKGDFLHAKVGLRPPWG